MTGGPGDGWRAALPELVIAAVFIAALAGAAYAWAGLNGAIVVLGCGAILSLVVLRLLPGAGPPGAAPAAEAGWRDRGTRSVTGFWRMRATVSAATTAMASYEAELRGTLQHLLAARLAERHGISLYTDPEAARRILVTSKRDQDLWYWLDPGRPPGPDDRPGIPPRTLAAVIRRLEQL